MSDSVRPHRLQPTRLPSPWDSPGKNTGAGYHFLLQFLKVKSESEVAQSRPTLRTPWTACSLPGSSTHGIFQARVLEGVAIAFSTCIYDVCLISVQLLSEILFWKKSFVLLTSKQFPRIALRNPKVRFVPIPYTFLFFLQFMSPEIMPFVVIIWLPRWHSGKEFACQCRRGGFDPWVGKISWRSAWQPTPVFLPAEFHGQRSLAGYSPWVTKSWTGLSTHAHCIIVIIVCS